MSVWEWVFVVSNAGITAGYLFIAACVAPFLDVPSRMTRLAGVTFFLTCGITHLDHAVSTVSAATSPLGHFAHQSAHDMIAWHSLINHVVQVVAVWFFVVGLYRHFVPAESQPVRFRRLMGDRD